MAININGGPYVPENCPQLADGPLIPDLREAAFTLHVHAAVGGGIEPIVETWGCFTVGNPEDGPCSHRETDCITTPIGSPLGKQLLRFSGLDAETDDSRIIAPEDEPQVGRLRQILCSCVVSCPGVIDGECWALGDTRFRNALNEVLPAPEV